MHLKNLIAKLSIYSTLSVLLKGVFAATTLQDVTGLLNSGFVDVLGIEAALFDQKNMHLVLLTHSQNITENEKLIEAFFTSTNAYTLAIGTSKNDTDAFVPPLPSSVYKSDEFESEEFRYDNRTCASSGSYSGSDELSKASLMERARAFANWSCWSEHTLTE